MLPIQASRLPLEILQAALKLVQALHVKLDAHYGLSFCTAVRYVGFPHQQHLVERVFPPWDRLQRNACEKTSNVTPAVICRPSARVLGHKNDRHPRKSRLELANRLGGGAAVIDNLLFHDNHREDLPLLPNDRPLECHCEPP